MIDSNIIEETLNELLLLYKEDKKLFCKTYRSIPLEIYSEIERLSVSKSTLFKGVCVKAKNVADNFHNNIV